MMRRERAVRCIVLVVGAAAPVVAGFLAAACSTAGPPAAGPVAAPRAPAPPAEAAPSAMPPEPARQPSGVELVGTVEIASGVEFAGTVVGGLSGLTFDAERGVYYAVSDDGGEHGPPRFYTLRIDLGDGRLDPGDVAVEGVTALLEPAGAPFAAGSVDGEGIAWVPGSGLFVSSEGRVDDGVPPFVRRFDLDGRQRGSLPLPGYYLPDAGAGVGVRHNLAFESLTATPDGSLLLTATENALAQDGPEADLDAGSPARILAYDLSTGVPVAEWIYPVEPVALPPQPADSFRVNGLVELLAVDRFTLLALERAWSAGAGHKIKLFRVSLAGATGILARPTIADLGDRLRPVAKTEVADLTAMLAAAGIAADNLEGLAWGPPLADGRRTLIVVADDNFSSFAGGNQRNLVLALALGPSP